MKQRLAMVFTMLVAQGALASEGKVLVDQVGYDTGAVKQAIVMDASGSRKRARARPP